MRKLRISFNIEKKMINELFSRHFSYCLETYEKVDFLVNIPTHTFQEKML